MTLEASGPSETVAWRRAAPYDGATSSLSALDVRILGPLEAKRDSRLLALGSPKQRALLAFLVLHANEVVARDRLVEELWGDAAPATVNAVLNGYVSKLRRLLADGDGDQLLLTRAPGYLLRIPAERIDARRFEALLKQGREELAAGDQRQAAVTLRAALSLWRDRPLADLAYEEFAQGEIRRLEELRLEALETRIEAELALGLHEAVVAELQRLVAEHPYRERLQGQFMLALYRCGRQADALATYRRARSMFADELGIDPGPRLSELERAILRQDRSLEPPPPAGRHEPSARAARLRVGARPRVALGAGLVIALALAAAVFAGLRAASDTAPVPIALAGDSVAVVDVAKTSVAGEVPVGARPSGVAAGDGSIWVGNRDDNTLLRIDPGSRRVVRTIGLPVEPREVAVAGEAVWVASTGVSLLRVDPSINAVVDTLRLGRGTELCCPPSLASGGGALWIAHDGRLSRINPRTNAVVTVREAGVASIAYGYRALWVLTSGGRIERLDPKSNSVLEAISRERLSYGGLGGGIAVGAGALWTGTYLDKNLWKIDPVSGNLVGNVSLDQRPAGVAFGGGAVWIVSTEGVLLRVDPGSERVVGRIRLGVYAAQAGSGALAAQGRWAPLAVGYGALWLPVTP